MENRKSPFIKHSVSAVMVLVTVSVLFLLMIFKSDDVRDEQLVTQAESVKYSNNRIRVDYQIQTDSSVNIPGITGDIPSLADSEVQQKLMDNGLPERKARAMACVYKYMIDRYGYNAAIGSMANVANEGSFGLIQYGHTMTNWNGPGQSAVSTGANPLIVRTEENIQSILEEYTGVGLVQWTPLDYHATLAELYRKYKTGTELTDEELEAAEMEMYDAWISTHGNLQYMNWNADIRQVAHDYCYYLEQPGDKDAKGWERANTAEEIHSWLSQ